MEPKENCNSLLVQPSSICIAYFISPSGTSSQQPSHVVFCRKGCISHRTAGRHCGSCICCGHRRCCIVMTSVSKFSLTLGSASGSFCACRFCCKPFTIIQKTVQQNPRTSVKTKRPTVGLEDTSLSSAQPLRVRRLKTLSIACTFCFLEKMRPGSSAPSTKPVVISNIPSMLINERSLEDGKRFVPRSAGFDAPATHASFMVPSATRL